MANLGLNSLPDESRYESACNVLPREDCIPEWIRIPGFANLNEKSTFYLTSNGDICRWPKSREFPPFVALSLKEVSNVKFHPKKVISPIPYFITRCAFLILGLILILNLVILVHDYVVNFDDYYYEAPDPSNPEATGTNVGDLGSESIYAVKFMLAIFLPILLMVYAARFALGRLHTWASRERLDFEANTGKTISFYGRYPMEGWFRFSYLGFYLTFMVGFPIFLLKPYVAFPLFAGYGAIAIIMIMIDVAKRYLIDQEFDPDEFMGNAEIKPLEAFFLDVVELSTGDDEQGVDDSEDSSYRFTLLIDRLGGEVKELADRLGTHEMALDEILQHRWRWTHQVSEIDMGLNQIRKVAERILGHRVTELGIELGRKPVLIDLKKILESNDAEHTTDGVLGQIDVINSICGRGSHAAKNYVEDVDSYIIALRSLTSIVDWHFENPVKK